MHDRISVVKFGRKASSSINKALLIPSWVRERGINDEES